MFPRPPIYCTDPFLSSLPVSLYAHLPLPLTHRYLLRARAVDTHFLLLLRVGSGRIHSWGIRSTGAELVCALDRASRSRGLGSPRDTGHGYEAVSAMRSAPSGWSAPVVTRQAVRSVGWRRLNSDIGLCS